MLYDINAPFEENLKRGPLFFDKIPERSMVPRDQWYKLFDYDVMRPIGISACPLTATVAGALLCSRFGFDVIIWKTIRSAFVKAHPHPNLVMLAPGSLQEIMQSTDRMMDDPDARALANSIGNASGELQNSLDAIATVRQQLLPGQILIVSIYGTGLTQVEIIADFVLLAQRVCEMDVHGIELNLSCPNVKTASYSDPEFVFAVTQAVVKAVMCPISIKMGGCDVRRLAEIMNAAARAGARAIAGINSIAARIHSADHQSFFGAEREYAGVSGAPIRGRAVEWVYNAAHINEKERYGLTIFGGGGITKPADFDLFLQAGATGAMTATGALYDITIAAQYAAFHQKELNEPLLTRSPACVHQHASGRE